MTNYNPNLSKRLDFNDTETAFGYLSDKALRFKAFMFKTMNYQWLVNLGSKLTLLALRLKLPIKGLIRKTIFAQFCGGTTLLNCQPTIDKLARLNTATVLDYGAEGKESQEDFDRSMNEVIRAIQFATRQVSVPVLSCKVTGLTRFALLEKLQRNETLTATEEQEYKNLRKRLDAICHVANENRIALYIDAEESWIQDPVDALVEEMMARYNKERVIIYNTYQMYRHDRLEYLKASFQRAQKGNYILGAKLVRGAYMEKENERAQKMGYPTPIQPNKEATDRDYNLAVEFCVKHFKIIASCVASHNEKSTRLQLQLIKQAGIAHNHPHITFCQLYGMSDNLTFVLAKAGYNVAKYVPYGPVADVIPYLIRRANENSAVKGEMSRELQLIKTELQRRKELD